MSTEDQPASASETPMISARGAARRRLTKAGVGAASVLWTLDSRATMKPMVCVSASGALSGGLSSNYTTKAPRCDGKSPGYWKNHSGNKKSFSSWPRPPETAFNDVFACYGTNRNTYGSKSLIEIVEGCSFDKFNFGMHLVATYLNVLSGRIGFLSVQSLQKMWNEIQSVGYYKPAEGVFWSAEQTKRYLEATHD
ncbi:hypothetical protein [Massilia sp. H6]|uniref:hypothetical protein n=1 Tax=Massilia sp. H6 TaxID=2970464 RepID=UPI0021696201|nr:hypothetical protein [Massilia sp. H6]UVW28907.1 hypothetical protein NRS07_01795 [Massilia sp. H6]